MPITAPKTITLTLKTAASTITGVVALLGAIWALDSHYATAADVQQIQRSFDDQFSQIRQDQLEDELFKLDVKKQAGKGKLDPVDQALYDRYTRKLLQNQQSRSMPRNQQQSETK